jgi:hypothetical protein
MIAKITFSEENMVSAQENPIIVSLQRVPLISARTRLLLPTDQHLQA